MNDPVNATDVQIAVKSAQLKQLTMIIYILYALSAFIGITGLAAIIINYIKREEAAGTLYESHFTWQIRTFWFTALWLVVYGLLIITIIGIPIAWIMIALLGLWVGYRVIRGWVALSGARPVG